jgi:chromosome segregation ATPase
MVGMKNRDEIINRLGKLQQEYIVELEHGNQAKKPGCEEQFDIIEDAIDFLMDEQKEVDQLFRESMTHQSQRNNLADMHSKLKEEIEQFQQQVKQPFLGWTSDKDILHQQREYWGAMNGIKELKEENEQLTKAHRETLDASARFVDRIKALEEALHRINSIQEDEGKKGCRYGDTEYDSLSVVYGFNNCLEWCKSIVKKALNPTPKTEQEGNKI